jgi:hypothetical protein
MKFAKIVFTGAGVWGIAVLTPLYFLFDLTGRQYAPPTSYPQFFYGFVSVAMAWQIAFLLIGSRPDRFRPLMVMAVIEKFSYVLTLVVMYLRSSVPAIDAMPAVPDGLLGILFVVAFIKTRAAKPHAV